MKNYFISVEHSTLEFVEGADTEEEAIEMALEEMKQFLKAEEMEEDE